MKFVKSMVASVALGLIANSAMADNFNPSFFKSNFQSQFDAMTEDFGSALSYKAITPAEPLGLTGFDLGLELSATQLESIEIWGDAIGDPGLKFLPLPKLHVHKGLPYDIDLGVVYSQAPSTDLQYWGGEIRYSFVSGNLAIPAIAVRGTYSQLIGIDELEFSTKGIELTVSKGIFMLTPYIGVGEIWVNSALDYTEANTNANISLDSDASLFKWFAGVNVNLGLMNVVFEADQTGESMTYTGKLGFRF